MIRHMWAELHDKVCHEVGGYDVSLKIKAVNQVAGIRGYAVVNVIEPDIFFRDSDCFRVNAMAPGFFLTEQNRTLMTNPDGSRSARAESILAHTPFGRFGEPAELLGTLHYLVSDASRFVTGTVIVVDGGFDAFSI